MELAKTLINQYLGDDRKLESEEIFNMLIQEQLYDLVQTSYWCKIVCDVAVDLITKRKGRWSTEILIESMFNIALSNAVKYISCET
jgi:hypothetical protein